MEKFFVLCCVVAIIIIVDAIAVTFVGFPPTMATAHLWLCFLIANVGCLFFPIREFLKKKKIEKIAR